MQAGPIFLLTRCTANLFRFRYDFKMQILSQYFVLMFCTHRIIQYRFQQERRLDVQKLSFYLCMSRKIYKIVGQGKCVIINFDFVFSKQWLLETSNIAREEYLLRKVFHRLINMDYSGMAGLDLMKARLPCYDAPTSNLIILFRCIKPAVIVFVQVNGISNYRV